MSSSSSLPAPLSLSFPNICPNSRPPLTRSQARNIHVFATSRSLSSLQHLKDVPNVTLLELDVTDVASIEKAVGVVGRDGGRLKYLVNNAGRGLIGPLLDGGVGCEVERKLWEVNYWYVVGVFCC